jgi:tetratricopeptide (TPR) repeat protein
VTRVWLVLLLLAVSSPIYSDDKQQPAEPPEEDVSSAPKEYTLNPLQAEKEVRIGNYYFKKGSYKAAARRFEEATRWNPSLADAFLRMGDAQLKLKNPKEARAAYSKFLELEPDSKNAPAVKKKLAGKL